jgi:hypothetical protein
MMHVTVLWGFMCMICAVRAGGGEEGGGGQQVQLALLTQMTMCREMWCITLDNLQL